MKSGTNPYERDSFIQSRILQHLTALDQIRHKRVTRCQLKNREEVCGDDSCTLLTLLNLFSFSTEMKAPKYLATSSELLVNMAASSKEQMDHLGRLSSFPKPISI